MDRARAGVAVVAEWEVITHVYVPCLNENEML